MGSELCHLTRPDQLSSDQTSSAQPTSPHPTPLYRAGRVVQCSAEQPPHPAPQVLEQVELENGSLRARIVLEASKKTGWLTQSKEMMSEYMEFIREVNSMRTTPPSPPPLRPVSCRPTQSPATPPRPPPLHPIPHHATLRQPRHPARRYPIPSYPIPYHTIPYHPIPSLPIPSHPHLHPT